MDLKEIQKIIALKKHVASAEGGTDPKKQETELAEAKKICKTLTDTKAKAQCERLIFLAGESTEKKRDHVYFRRIEGLLSGKPLRPPALVEAANLRRDIKDDALKNNAGELIKKAGGK